MQQVLKVVIALLVIMPAAFPSVQPVSAADRKPNFVYIFTDDQRWDALGVVQREQGEHGRFPSHVLRDEVRTA